MKKYLLLIGFFAVANLSTMAKADGPAVPPPHVRVNHVFHSKAAEEPPIPPEPVCHSQSTNPKVRLISWDPDQKVSKFIGEIQECVTTQWEVLRLLSGPNAINLRYPEEHERWGYLWLWAYKLQNPMEDTMILMDNPGKRILKGKNPVELYITFNKDDVVERVEMDLIKKKNSQYVEFQ